MMTPNVIRELWKLVDITQTNLLLDLSDIDLAQWLTQQLQRRGTVPNEDIKACKTYISSRVPLIRDLAHDRGLSYP